MSVTKQLLATAAVAALSLGLATGCGERSEAEAVAVAKGHLEQNRAKTAIVEIKSALQKKPQSAELRYLLGVALLQDGNARDAAVELNKARDYRYPGATLLPTLAQALLANGELAKVIELDGQTGGDRAADAELKSVVAAAYLRKGDLGTAKEAVKVALQLDPANAAAQLLQARLVAAQGASDEALRLVDELLKANAKNIGALTLKGELLWVAKGDVAGGEKWFRQALAVDERSGPANSALLQLLLQRNDVEGFKKQLAHVKKAMPNSFLARFYTVVQSVTDNDLTTARTQAQQLLTLSPDYPPLLQLAGMVALRNNELAQAQVHLGQAIQLSENLSGARRLLAEAQLRAGQSAKALVTLKPLLDVPRPRADALGMAAQAYLQSGDSVKAEAYYTLASRADPEDPKAPVMLALSQVSKGQADAGLAQLESLASDDKSTYADLALVTARIQRKDLDGALKAIDGLQRKTPDKPLPYFMRARVLLQKGDVAGARASFQTALDKDPLYFQAVAELATLDLQDKKPQDARKRFEAVLARDPNNVFARLGVADLREREGTPPAEIEALLVDAVKVGPREAAPRLRLIEHYLNQRQAKTALATAQEAVAKFPEDMALLEALGRSQLAAGDAQQAAKTFRQISASARQSPEPHMRLARMYLASRNHAAAIASLEKALEVSPKLLAAQRALVQIHVERKNFDDAVKVARQVQKERPDESVGYLIEAEVQASRRAWDPALAALQAALKRDPTTPVAMQLHATYALAGRGAAATRFAADWERDHPRDADFLFHLGAMAMDQREDAAAESRFRQVLALRPNSAAALNNLAMVTLRQGKPGALQLAERANQIAPEQAPIFDTLATAQAAESDLDKALAWQRKAVAKAPQEAIYRLNLAKLLIRAKQPAEAKAELEKLAARGPNFAGHAEVTSLLKTL